MTGIFGGAVVEDSVYNYPAGSEVWGGFANLDVDVYPFTFANGGSITFTAAVAAGGSDTNVYFRFERLPFPDVEPSFTLENVLVVGEAELEYTVTIPPQDAANTYESFLLYVVEQDSPVMIKDIVVTDDTGSTGVPSQAIDSETAAVVISDFAMGASLDSTSDLSTSNSNASFTAVYDADREAVLQVTHTGDASLVVGPIALPGANLSGVISISFDIKVINQASVTGFMLKALSNNGFKSGQTAVTGITGSGDWESVTVSLSSLVGLDPSFVTVPFEFSPDAGTGAGLVYQIDNVRWEAI